MDDNDNDLYCHQLLETRTIFFKKRGEKDSFRFNLRFSTTIIQFTLERKEKKEEMKKILIKHFQKKTIFIRYSASLPVSFNFIFIFVQFILPLSHPHIIITFNTKSEETSNQITN